MFEAFFTLPVLLALLVGAIIGVGLGRRSNTANAAYDRLRDRAERAEQQLRDWHAQRKD